MFRKYTFTILGGDKRQVVIAKKLIACGHTVRIYGLGELSVEIPGAELFCGHEKAIEGSDVIILPLPATKDNVFLYFRCDPSGIQLRLSEIISLAAKGGCRAILGGMLPADVIASAELKGICAVDYYKDEALQRKNALPSAEGALMIAMENTEKVIKGMSTVVCGYGRIGSCLSNILYGMGANVTVMARRDEILCEAALNGYKSVRIKQDEPSEMISCLEKCDVIFNTVPHVIFSRRIIEKLKHKPLYIEIASSPGGIDTLVARELGIQTVFAPSLPGKYAPISAGEYIFETIFDILVQKGIMI